jgi:hypothetical protein
VLVLSDTVVGMNILAVEMSLVPDTSYSVTYGSTVVLISSGECACH